ncbi:protein of unknown function [Nitrospira japonica]|uniref:Uncharacterized protein n=1 Tax=Nitrospira japonica TaxID=1325564 RepID=A0A1W1I1Z5_9BACT|nr:protein of unknown function [Nitrospira japonica]
MQPAWPCPVRLAFFGTIDPTQSDSLRLLTVHDFDGVAVEDEDNKEERLTSCRRTRQNPGRKESKPTICPVIPLRFPQE